MSRLHPDASWWLKLNRAQKHLDEYKGAIAQYTAGRKHPVIARVESKQQPRWVYRVEPETEPDPAWAVPIGDFLFNCRAALDHMAVALNPPKMKNKLIYFPILIADPWRRVEGSRRYVEPDPANRRNFAHWTKRMPEEARAFIKRIQPYAMAKEQGGDPEDHVLVILKRLNDTDKHRHLLVSRAGVDGGRLLEPRPDGTVQEWIFVAPFGRAAEHGAVVLRLPYKVDVDFMGSITVGLGRTLDRIQESKTFDSIYGFVERTLMFLETCVPPSPPHRAPPAGASSPSAQYGSL